MRIAFVYAGGREVRWTAALNGRAPSDFFYGAVELARNGNEILCIDAPDPGRSLLAAVCNKLFGARTPARTRGEHLVATARVLHRLRSADVVVAASTSHANALALWKRLGFFRGKLVGIHCGHVNYALAGARRRATRRAMSCQEVVLFAGSERDETIRQCGVEPARLHANPFGVDVNFWSPASREGEFLLAVGNDGRRDYATLIAAIAKFAIPVKIVTARPLPRPLPAHVEHLSGSWHAPAVTDEELRDLYRRALAVVVPLEDSIQPSGQSVALQAMACGRPVILTRTRGLWTGGDYLDGRDLLLVPPASFDVLRELVQRLLDDPALREQIGRSAREAVLRHGRIEDFASRLGALFGPADPAS
ncbi:MAG: glycosyltransferase family 4 protein [Terrimicrobiaceae bacterium]|nr:glycosyltransferase family 4 protein [Terrimicrobiaceae bacterium]